MSVKFYRISFWIDMSRYIVTWPYNGRYPRWIYPIYRHVTHLRSFYKRIWRASIKDKHDPKLILSSFIWFMYAITCILFIRYGIRNDIQYLITYRDISPGIWYPIYYFADRYIADIWYLKHWVSGGSSLQTIIQSRGLIRRIGEHWDALVAASRNGLKRYAQNAIYKA